MCPVDPPRPETPALQSSGVQRVGPGDRHVRPHPAHSPAFVPYHCPDVFIKYAAQGAFERSVIEDQMQLSEIRLEPKNFTDELSRHVGIEPFPLRLLAVDPRGLFCRDAT